MDYVTPWRGLTFDVDVIIILILFDSFRGENVHTSLTKTKYTWSQARNKCSLIGNEHTNITIPTLNSDLIWTGDSARYLPWVEYLGCFGLKEERQLIIDKTHVESGKQLKECLLHCKQSSFIGLQQSNCVCLHFLELTSEFLETPCNAFSTRCQEDQTAFCGTIESRYISEVFSIYQKVNVTERVDDGNCLAVDNNNDSFNYIALNCSTTAFQICIKDSVSSNKFYQQNTSIGTWIDSFKLCQKSYMLARYSLVYNKPQFSATGTYWLSNTRKWIQGTSTNPEFCIAARIKEDGSLKRFPLRCERKLPGLCVSREWTSAYVPSENTFSTAITEATQYLHATNGYKRTPSDDQAPIDEVLLISVIAATGFIILVATVIVIICIRRTSTRTEQQPTLVSQNEVVYENESNNLNRNQTVNDTIDHMHYQSLNQNRNQIDSNYDILHNAEVDVTSDRQPQRDINKTAEQRKMEADYQEIEDVSI
ncbi:uncharacterized protein [Mytilus edulis]|uniref:uncharacterized protein n=1 Tax=Mytilus edulis TaxID=6550 RepID=UPI0039F08EFE